MNLTLDANILVSTLDRDEHILSSLLLHPALAGLFIAEYTFTEAEYVMNKRRDAWVRGGLAPGAADTLYTSARMVHVFRCIVFAEGAYAMFEEEARLRVPGDPDDDWHVIALALATKTDVWTLDRQHFHGCGIATWETRTLRSILDYRGRATPVAER